MSSNPALTFPQATNSTPPPNAHASTSNAPPSIRKDRLYVGNLHPTVDEYALLQIFSKCGKISRLDFLFHKTGPSKGKPRGYAFVEYSSSEDAAKALSTFHDRVVRGRKLVVTYATETPYLEGSSTAPGARSGHRRHASDVTRPTTLSLIKTHAKPDNTQAKIAALEAKLKQLQAPPGPAGQKPSGLASLPKKPPPESSRS